LEVVKTGVEQSAVKTYGLPQETIGDILSTEV